MDTTRTAPTQVTGLTSYYLGRPNSVYLDRFGTRAGRHARTTA